MRLFDKLFRVADEQSDRPHPSPDADLLPPLVADDAPSRPSPSPAPAGPTARTRTASDGYDPSRPGQTPVSGIDLVTFATVSRRLVQWPAAQHDDLLSRYGHTPDSWRAVHTVWMARLGQMPHLYDIYDSAHRSV